MKAPVGKLHSILRGVSQKQQHLDLKHRLRVRPCWLSDGLLSPDAEGVWVLLRTGLLGSSETGLFSFRYFSSLGQKARMGEAEKGNRQGRWEVRGQCNIYPAQWRPFTFRSRKQLQSCNIPLLLCQQASPLSPQAGRALYQSFLNLPPFPSLSPA